MAKRNDLSPGASPALRWETSPVVYVGPASLQITGIDRTGRYNQGTVCFVPGAGRYASVLFSEYTGGNTNVYLTDAVCHSGMALGYVPPVLSQTNLCTGGTAISGGYSSTYTPAKAFDGVWLAAAAGTLWISSQSKGGINGVSWLGYQFAAAKSIRWFQILQPLADGTDAAYHVLSVILRYSDNGTAWTNHSTHTLNPSFGRNLCVAPVPAAAHTYWSLLANSDVPGVNGAWGVIELAMGE